MCSGTSRAWTTLLDKEDEEEINQQVNNSPLRPKKQDFSKNLANSHLGCSCLEPCNCEAETWAWTTVLVEDDEDEIKQVGNVALQPKKTPVEHCACDHCSECRSSQIHLNNEGCGSLGYSVQETGHGTRGVEIQSEKIAPEEEDSTTSNNYSSDITEQNARVDVASQECNFEDTKCFETECKTSFQSRIEPEPPPVQHIKTAKTKNVKKRRIPSSSVREIPKDLMESKNGSGSGGGAAKKQKTKGDKSGRVDNQPAVVSALDNAGQYLSPGHGEAAIVDQQLKAKIKHPKDHQGWKQWSPCPRCAKPRAVIQKHTKVCHVQGCRVADCRNIRKGTNDLQMPRQNHSPKGVNNLTPERDKHKSHVDGKVIFRNSKLLAQYYFRENTDYKVDRNCRLGAGGNGTIYLVSLQRKRIEIVVKETHYRKEELEVYKILGEHKNIVTHYGVTFRGNDRRKVNIFMEKCDVSLFRYMKNLHRRLTVDEAMFYWVQVLDGVCYLHNLPIPVIHKDIKAENVLLTKDYSRAKLADFDSAMRLPHEFTEAGLRPCGTPGFVSPEVKKKNSHGKPADIYSMGCCLIQLIIGAPTEDTLKEKIDKLREVNADLAQLVEACVEECPEERPTARSLLTEWAIIKTYIPGVEEWS